MDKKLSFVLQCSSRTSALCCSSRLLVNVPSQHINGRWQRRMWVAIAWLWCFLFVRRLIIFAEGSSSSRKGHCVVHLIVAWLVHTKSNVILIKLIIILQ